MKVKVELDQDCVEPIILIKTKEITNEIVDNSSCLSGVSSGYSQCPFIILHKNIPNIKPDYFSYGLEPKNIV